MRNNNNNLGQFAAEQAQAQQHRGSNMGLELFGGGVVAAAG
jgi:hypothetical protein